MLVLFFLAAPTPSSLAQLHPRRFCVLPKDSEAWPPRPEPALLLDPLCPGRLGWLPRRRPRPRPLGFGTELRRVWNGVERWGTARVERRASWIGPNLTIGQFLGKHMS